MKTKWPPQPDLVLADLAPLTELLYPAMDAAADHAVQYFEDHSYPELDLWLHAHLMRHYLKQRLVAEGIGALRYQFISLPFSGIWLENEQYCVRVLKVAHRLDMNTRLPRHDINGPGYSRARREYFNQPSLEFEEDDGPLTRLRVPQKLKLVALWDIDSHFQLSGLELACPRAVSSKRNVVQTHWWVPIPDPRATVQVETIPEFGKPIVLDDIEFPNEGRKRAVGDDDADSR